MFLEIVVFFYNSKIGPTLTINISTNFCSISEIFFLLVRLAVRLTYPHTISVSCTLFLEVLGAKNEKKSNFVKNRVFSKNATLRANSSTNIYSIGVIFFSKNTLGDRLSEPQKNSPPPTVIPMLYTCKVAKNAILTKFWGTLARNSEFFQISRVAEFYS